ncbi:MAG TPA: DUF2993 domain-containing protein [Mycobacteriales bacterium]|nr:DUF2993 domain-containing protein [Mycobacteriales bacterium]
MRRLLVLIAVLAVLLAVADRVAVRLAESAVATRIKIAEQLSSSPAVSIGGFPFLTQAISGRYDNLSVTVTGLRRGSATITRLSVDLRGVRVPLSAIVHRAVSSIPVASATGTVQLSYADLDAAVASRGITVAYGGSPGTVTVTYRGTSRVGRVRVDGDAIAVDVSAAGAGGVTVGGPAAGLFDFTVSLPSLPFHIALQTVTADPAGVQIAAAAGAFTISTAG